MKEVIGSATLYCGDCLDILPTLDKVDAVVTDPPYGINATSSMNGKHGKSQILGDESVIARDSALLFMAGAQFLVFGSWKQPKPAGTKAVLIWDKTERSGMGDLSMPWKPNTEEIYVIGNGFKSNRRGSSVLRYTPHLPCVGTVMETDHPYQKPISLMESLVSSTQGLVCDPFMGSGTTGVACMNLGREFIGIEKEPKYFDIACERIRQAQAQGRLFA